MRLLQCATLATFIAVAINAQPPPPVTSLAMHIARQPTETEQGLVEVGNLSSKMVVELTLRGECEESGRRYPIGNATYGFGEYDPPPLPPGVKAPPPRPNGPLRSGESRSFPINLRCQDGRPAQMSLAGVIFDDGALEGDPKALENSIQRRKGEAEALQRWLPRFSALREAVNPAEAAGHLYRELTDALYELERDPKMLHSMAMRHRQGGLRRLQLDAGHLASHERTDKNRPQWDWLITQLERRYERMKPFLSLP